VKMPHETDKALKEWASEIQTKVEDHFAHSSDPLLMPSLAFKELTPYLTGVYLTDSVDFLDMTLITSWMR
jgi:hypothetical protein